MRLAAIALLGGRCALCGIDDPVVLNVDHVEDDGARERLTLSPPQLCARLARGTLHPARYQLLCCNCNWRKEYFRRKGTAALSPPERRANQNDGKVLCINGHLFSPENTYFRRDRPGHRLCKACNVEAQRRYAERQ